VSASERRKTTSVARHGQIACEAFFRGVEPEAGGDHAPWPRLECNGDCTPPGGPKNALYVRHPGPRLREAGLKDPRPHPQGGLKTALFIRLEVSDRRGRQGRPKPACLHV